MAANRKRKRHEFLVSLDEDDHKLLVKTAALERLTKSETVRRAIRVHARRVRQTVASA